MATFLQMAKDGGGTDTMKNNDPNKTLNPRIRRIYSNMKTRCYNPISNRYNRYGGRGISVCKEWLDSFGVFQKWALENGYADDLTLDRIDNNGNYCPENCRWATYKEQRRNSTGTRTITINGKTKIISEWCEQFCIPYYVVNNRLNKYGWSIEKSLQTPVKVEKKYKVFGKELTINEIHKITGDPKYNLYRKLRDKDKLEEGIVSDSAFEKIKEICKEVI